MVLTPTVSTTTRTQTIGIFVVRVTGKRKLLGRTVPRIKQVGRVPLGATRKGRNTFRWNGKVNGKRLKRGTYLLDVPRAPRHAHRQHLRLRPLHRDRPGPHPRREARPVARLRPYLTAGSSRRVASLDFPAEYAVRRIGRPGLGADTGCVPRSSEVHQERVLCDRH